MALVDGHKCLSFLHVEHLAGRVSKYVEALPLLSRPSVLVLLALEHPITGVLLSVSTVIEADHLSTIWSWLSGFGRVLDLPLGERLEGTLACLVGGVLRGAQIVRVHDVRESVRAVRMADALKAESEE